MVLAQVCEGQVTSTGAEGEPTPTCPTGESCLPSTGRCGSDTIDANALPTFVPGESLDAGPDAGAIVLMPGPVNEAGGSDAGSEGTDATIADAGGGDADVEALLVRDRRTPIVLGTAHVDGEATDWAPWSVPVTGLEGDGALASVELAVLRATAGTRVLLGGAGVVAAGAIACGAPGMSTTSSALSVK